VVEGGGPARALAECGNLYRGCVVRGRRGQGWFTVSAMPKHDVIEMGSKQLHWLWQMADGRTHECVSMGPTGYIAAVETQTLRRRARRCVEGGPGSALALQPLPLSLAAQLCKGVKWPLTCWASIQAHAALA
jgi:hypothetical protein